MMSNDRSGLPHDWYARVSEAMIREVNQPIIELNKQHLREAFAYESWLTYGEGARD